LFFLAYITQKLIAQNRD